MSILNYFIALLILFCTSVVAIPTNGLVAYYSMDGNSNDNSGNGNHGSDTGNVRYVDGVIGQARDFDRVGGLESIDLPNTLNSTSYTVSMWVNLRSMASHNSLLMLNSGTSWSDSDFWLFTSHSRIALLQGRTDLRRGIYETDFLNSATLNSDQTYSITVTYEQNALSVYVDGALYTQYTSVPDVPINPTNLNIGISPSGSGNYQIDGFVDEVYIYDRALSAAEVGELAVPEPQAFVLMVCGIVCFFVKNSNRGVK